MGPESVWSTKSYEASLELALKVAMSSAIFALWMRDSKTCLCFLIVERIDFSELQSYIEEGASARRDGGGTRN